MAFAQGPWGLNLEATPHVGLCAVFAQTLCLVCLKVQGLGHIGLCGLKLRQQELDFLLT